MSTSSRRHPRILVVESDPLIQSLIVEWLQMAGNETMTAGDLASAVRSGHRPDIVLADVPAPHRAARQTVQRLRQTLPGTPVIAMSADVAAIGNAARDALAGELGAVAVLVKPFTQHALLTAVHRAQR